MIKRLIKDVTYPIIKSRPDFLIIGEQKAGTTSLYNYLTQHPQVFGNIGWKEVRYFDRPEHYNQGFGWYLGHFPSKLRKGNKLTCDASPNYLSYEFVPERIKKDLGDIKMIAVLREPVSRAYSAWQMFHSFANIDNDHLRRFYDKRTFAEAVEEEFSPNFDHAKYPFRYDYVGRGKYVHHLENYYNYFDKETILVLNMEQFRKDLGAVLNRVCDFLSIEHFSQEILEKLQQEKHNQGKYKFHKTPADQEKLEFIKSYFVPFNEKLYEMLGENYNW
ncbi:MAG: sulfotransferase domain-containing protein [Coleofasciculus sp. G1-WW12-02]|uniref:sulfotransferase domain-containing protein n=1 Tax=Coleofasciculus sp. G1-WW12-02 TaxID=3068483 RepID=UPI0032F36BD9